MFYYWINVEQLTWWVFMQTARKVFFSKKTKKKQREISKNVGQLGKFSLRQRRKKGTKYKKMCQAGNNYPRNSRRQVWKCMCVYRCVCVWVKCETWQSEHVNGAKNVVAGQRFWLWNCSQNLNFVQKLANKLLLLLLVRVGV